MSDWNFSPNQDQPVPATPTGPNTPNDFNAEASVDTAVDIAAMVEAQDPSPSGLSRAQELLRRAYEADQAGKRVQIHIPGMEASRDGKPLVLDGSMLYKSVAANALAPKPTPVRANPTLEALEGYTGITDATTITGRTMAFLEGIARTPAVQLIVRTRINQGKRFCRYPRFKGDIGFQVRQIQERKQLTGAAAKERDALEDFLLHGGYRYDTQGNLRRRKKDGQPGVWDGNEEVLAGGLQRLVTIMIRQALTLDWAPVRFEPGGDEKTMPVAWFSNADIDAKNILRAREDRYTPQIDKSGLPISFVELENASSRMAATVRREFAWNRMAVMVRNPRTDILGLGYGFSELEAALDVLSSMILNLKFRGQYFDNNHIPPAIVVMRGQLAGFSDSSMSALRTQLASKAGNAEAFFKLLYLGLPPDPSADIKILPLRAQTGAVSEMEYAQADFTALMTLLCALFQIDPQEVGYKSEGSGGGLQEADPETRLEHSQDKGLVPLMQDIAGFINQSIVQFVNPDFEFVWVGLEPSVVENDKGAQARLALGDTPNQIKDAQDRPRELNPNDTTLHTKTQRKFEPDKYDTPEEWRSAVDQAYEKEFEKIYGDEAEAWSTAWDEPVGNVEMMQTRQAEKDELKAAKKQQQQIQDLIDGGMKPEDAKKQVRQQAQQQEQGGPGGAPGGPGGPGGAPGMDGAMPAIPGTPGMDGGMPEEAGAGGPEDSPLNHDALSDDDDPNSGESGAGAVDDGYDAQEDDQDWERYGGGRGKLNKSQARPDAARPLRRTQSPLPDAMVWDWPTPAARTQSEPFSKSLGGKARRACLRDGALSKSQANPPSHQANAAVTSNPTSKRGDIAASVAARVAAPERDISQSPQHKPAQSADAPSTSTRRIIIERA